MRLGNHPPAGAGMLQQLRRLAGANHLETHRWLEHALLDQGTDIAAAQRLAGHAIDGGGPGAYIPHLATGIDHEEVIMGSIDDGSENGAVQLAHEAPSGDTLLNQ